MPNQPELIGNWPQLSQPAICIASRSSGIRQNGIPTSWQLLLLDDEADLSQQIRHWLASRAETVNEATCFVAVSSVPERLPARNSGFDPVYSERPAQIIEQPLRFGDMPAEPDPASRIANWYQALVTSRQTAVTGPTLPDRDRLIDDILQTPEVRQQMTGHTSWTEQTTEYAEQHARDLLEQISADYDPLIIKRLDKALAWLWRRLYRNVFIFNADSMRELALNHRILLLPCHRSHLDYMLLSYGLYQHGLIPPHVAAGDNLNIPIVGRILKRSGAIFMRRTFKGDPLYSTLFRHYLKQLSERGFTLEFYPEGGRSRTGRLKQARTGMLDIILNNEQFIEADKPLAIVPVTVSYDRLVEIESYLQQLDGAGKRSESLGNTLWSAIKCLTRNYGNAALSFAQPIIINKQVLPDTRALARQVMQNMNRSTILHGPAVYATLMLSRSAENWPNDQLRQTAQSLKQLILELPEAPQLSSDDCPQDWLDAMLSRGQLNQTSEFISVTDKQAQELTFYRNNIQHMLIIPGLLLLLCYRSQKTTASTLTRIIRPLYPFLAAELHLPWDDKQLPEILKQIRNLLCNKGLLVSDGTHYSSQKTDLSIALMRHTERVLVRYVIVLKVLQLYRKMERELLIEHTQRIARSLHQSFGFHSPEYSDKEVLMQFVEQLQVQQLLDPEQVELEYPKIFDKVLVHAERLLNPAHIELINQQLNRP